MGINFLKTCNSVNIPRYHPLINKRVINIFWQVRSFGTEGRKLDGQQIQPSNEIFDFIEFPSHDIKQLTVCQLPPSVPQQNPTPSGQVSVSPFGLNFKNFIIYVRIITSSKYARIIALSVR